MATPGAESTLFGLLTPLQPPHPAHTGAFVAVVPVPVTGDSSRRVSKPGLQEAPPPLTKTS